MRIEDEEGNPWSVQAGDPASAVCTALHRRGFDWLVLTQDFLCGILSVESLVAADRPLPVVPTSPSDALLRGIRLSDCIVELRKEAEQSNSLKSK